MTWTPQSPTQETWTAVPPTLGPPVNVTLPVITPSSGGVGQTFSASTGSWQNNPIGFDYQWLRDGVAIPGTASATYRTTLDDGGTALSVQVTATNSSGNTPATSAAVNVPVPFIPSLNFSDPRNSGFWVAI